jgi:hypothetical protein
MYRKSGAEVGPYGMENIDMGRRLTVDSLLGVIRRNILERGLFDGLFLDGSEMYASGEVVNGDSVDYRRNGYPSYSAYYDSVAVLMEHFVSELHRLAPGWLLFGNGGRNGSYAHLNGFMHERFPNLNGGTWTSNMVQFPSHMIAGYLYEDPLYRQPTLSWLATVRYSRDSTHAENRRLARWILGNACLGSGVGCLVPQGSDKNPGDIRSYLGGWWFDEYAVNFLTGKASTSVNYKHWLGHPTSTAKPTARGVWRRDFQNGVVLVNPTYLPQTIGLEQPYRMILGKAAPNYGYIVTGVSIPPQDALFLLRRLK